MKLPLNRIRLFVSSAELRLIRPMVCEKGLRFTLRDGGKTLGTGVITNALKDLTDADRLKILEGKKKIKQDSAEG